MRLFKLLAFAISFLLSHAIAVQAEELKPGNHRFYLTVNSVKRSFYVHIPKKLSGDKVPAVLVLHGVISNAGHVAWDSQMSKKSEQDGFIVVYPNGFGLSWNAGDCCYKGAKEKIDDVAFIRSLILKIRAELPIDPKRVFVTGISNGGMMAYRLGQEIPDLIAAIAPVEGCMRELNKPSIEPMNVVIFNGTADTVIPYAGGTGNWWGYKIATNSVSDAVKYWVNADHCQLEPAHEDYQSSTKDVYRGGSNGSEVCLYTIKGCKHTWPGGRLAKVFHWRDSAAFSATDAMCDFFWSHPKIEISNRGQSAF